MNKFTHQALLLFFFFGITLSWWDVGHMLVSKIAQIKLKEKHQEAYDSFNDLVKGFENLTDGKSNSFVEAAVWPDDIKQYKANYFDDYHFTDIVYDPHFMFVSMQQFQKDINSINVVGSCMSVLKTNKNQVTFERAFMARYLLHLVGDIHQPLHSSCMYNESFKTGDMGGNLVKIETQKYGEMNLHAFLDSMGGIQKPDDRPVRPLTEEGKVYIDALARQIMTEFSEQSFGDLSDNLSAHTWAVESYNKAVTQVYPFVFENKKTTAEWEEKIKTISRERVALGGYRLANSIQTIYK